MWIASLLACAFSALALLHVYWAFGGQWGVNAALPHVPESAKHSHCPGVHSDAQPMVRAFNPGTGATLVVAAALGFIAALVIAQANLLGTAYEHPALRWLLFSVAVVMLLRAIGDFHLVGFFKKITGSRFARLDSLVFSPLCVVLGMGLSIVGAT